MPEHRARPGRGSSPAVFGRPLWRQFLDAARALRALLFEADEAPDRPSPLGSLDPATSDLLYSALRSWGLTQVRLRRLTKKQPAVPVVCLLAVAFSCLRRDYRPPAVVVDQAVRAARQLGGLPTSAFVNALLRRVLVETAAADQDALAPESQWNAPAWWRNRLLAQLGESTAAEVMCLQQVHPPFTLRYLGPPPEREAFEAGLQASGRDCQWLDDQAVMVRPAADPVSLPGYAEGLFRVQDWAAQQMMGLLPMKSGDIVLDACAAPGGKTLLALEQADVTVWAMDCSATRLARLDREWGRLSHRLQGQLQQRVADLTQDWPPDAPLWFDHIILDAPCTGSGVVRRHPDIPWRRSPDQLARVVGVQRSLLDRLWQRLKPGGECLYMTCSIFHEEGEDQLLHFLSTHPDAERLSAPGLLLPTANRDGFFFGRLRRQA